MLFAAILLLSGIVSAAREARSVQYAAVPATPEAMLAGTADTPWQYRDLIPLAVKALRSIPVLANSDPLVVFLIIDRLVIISIFAVACILLKKLGAGSGWILTLFLMLLANYAYGSPVNYFFPYDMPAILLFMLGLVLLLDGKLVQFHLLLPLALLNRETAAALTLVFAATYYKAMPPRAFAGCILLQLGVIVLMKFILWRLFIDNAGYGLGSLGDVRAGDRLLINLHDLAGGRILPIFAGLYLPFAIAIPYLTCPFVKRALWVIPPYCFCMALLANLIEFRVFSEIIPLIMIALADGVPNMLRRRRGVAPTGAG